MNLIFKIKKENIPSNSNFSTQTALSSEEITLKINLNKLQCSIPSPSLSDLNLEKDSNLSSSYNKYGSVDK